jgi:hypothetical protein
VAAVAAQPGRRHSDRAKERWHALAHEEEFVRFYRWLECPDVPVHPPYCRALRLIMLACKRVDEIATLQ